MSSQVTSTRSPSAETETERSGLSEQKRRDLADFLRTRRERMKPESVGIVQVSRRRTPGLRREEVAELASVGTTWYTWLEQARDIQPSADVLRRLARALMLNTAETRHLFALAGKTPPVEIDGQTETPPESLVRLLETSFNAPAFLIGLRWDVLAVNSRAAKEMPVMAEVAARRGNLVEHFFTEQDPSWLQNWETIARNLVAEFRESLSASLDHPWVHGLIESLRQKSEAFDQFWKDHEVNDALPTIVEIKGGPKNAIGRFERTILRTSSDPRFKIVVMNPVR